MDPELNTGEETLETEETSLRDSVISAVDELTEEPSKPTSEAPATGEPAGDKTAPAGAANPAAGAPVENSQAPTQSQQPTELKAPSQWKPQVREKWNQLPREVQEEVLRRENDNMRLIGSVGGKIRMADNIAQQLQPFIPRLQENGVAPEAFIGDIFTTVKSLAHGSPQEKAEVIANVVQSYGVDLRVLDAVLAHRLNQPPEVMEARRQTARAQAVIQQQQSVGQEQAATQALREIEKFAADPKNEFFEDVRDQMANLMELGQVKTLAEAYTACIWANPNTRSILLQREAEARVNAKTGKARAAKQVSQSVSGAPRLGAAGSAAKANAASSLREDIEAAMNQVEDAA